MQILQFLQASPLALSVTAALAGLAVGSFLNVVAHRLPKMMERAWQRDCRAVLNLPGGEEETPYNLVVPSSRCPLCGHGIRAWENIPVLSWLWLKGRCSACGARISARYPLVELTTGVLSAAVAWRFGFSVPAAFALVLTWGLIALSAIDLDCRLLPDDITLPLLWLGLLVNLGGVFAPLSAAVIGAAAGYLVLWSVYQVFRLLTGKEGMGYGDFKLLAMLGAWLGWPMLPLIIVASSLIGSIVGIALLLRGRERSEPIPFGPYLAGAGWIALMWGPEITHLYLQWVAGS
jgi:leader peptidase (prepilin peptidase)/N-methyltransferase